MGVRKLFTPPSKHEDGSRIFCAPFVMASLTGKSMEQIYKVINKARPNEKPRIHGMFMGDINHCLNIMGFKLDRCNISDMYHNGNPPTLAKWIDSRVGNMRQKTYLLFSHNHVMLVSGNMFIDTASKEPVFVDQAPRRRTRIVSFFEVTGR